MGSDWIELTIEELASSEKSSLSTGPFGSAISAKFFQEEGVPVIRGSNLSTQTSDKMNDDGLVFVSEEKASEFKRSIVRAGDLIFTCWGTINQVGLITEECKYSEYIISNKQMKATLDKAKADPLFVYYYFSSPIKQKEIIQNGIGAAVPGFNLGQLKQHKLRLPSLTEQKKISSFLGLLDNKITLNRQINQTLEQMAQTLFKSWFVDFDPVIDNALDAGNAIPDELQARAEQRQALRNAATQQSDASATPVGNAKPLPDNIRQLFPSEFEESELGWVPKGWGITQVKDLASTTKGKSYKSSELSESDTALVTLKSFQRGGGYRLDGLKAYTGSYKSEQLVEAGDLVVAYTDVTQAADIIGKPAIVISDPEFKKLVISLDVAVVRPSDKRLKYFLYALTKTSRFQRHTYAHSTGTTVLHLSKDAIPDFQFVFPNESVFALYDQFVANNFDKIEKNICSIRTLTKLRDTLLPKLISGELRLDDVESTIKETMTA